jgi:hypothetical protein
MKCPRPESNRRTRFRRALLYPLSYGGESESQSRGNTETGFPAIQAGFALFGGIGFRCSIH